MLGLDRGVSGPEAWKALAKRERPPFMTGGEKLRMAVTIGGMLLFLGLFVSFARSLGTGGESKRQGGEAAPGLAETENEALRAKEREWADAWKEMRQEHGLPGGPGDLGGAPAAAVATSTATSSSPAVAPATGEGTAASGPEVEPSELERQMARARAEEWARVEREYGLPEGFDRDALPPLDKGLLGWVEDGNRERERAPFHHLLRWVLSRRHEDIEREAEKSPDTRWLQGPSTDFDQRIEAAKSWRGKVVHFGAQVVSEPWMRPLEDEGAPRPWVWEGMVRDRDRNLFLVVCADKDVELEPDDVVWVTGVFFKLLRVRTNDGKDRGYPVVVVRAIRLADVTVQRPPFLSPLIAYVVGFGAFALAVMGVHLFLRWRAPPAPLRKRSALNNQRVRGLDRSKRAVAGAGAEATPAAPPAGAIVAPPADASVATVAPAGQPDPASLAASPSPPAGGPEPSAVAAAPPQPAGADAGQVDAAQA